MAEAAIDSIQLKEIVQGALVETLREQRDSNAPVVATPKRLGILSKYYRIKLL